MTSVKNRNHLVMSSLANHAATRSMIGYWHHTVICLSARNLCRVALRLEIYRCVLGRVLPIHLIGHLLYRNTNLMWWNANKR